MRDIKFEQWQWEEELTVFTLEEVGLGKVCELILFSISAMTSHYTSIIRMK